MTIHLLIVKDAVTLCNIHLKFSRICASRHGWFLYTYHRGRIYINISLSLLHKDKFPVTTLRWFDFPIDGARFPLSRKGERIGRPDWSADQDVRLRIRIYNWVLGPQKISLQLSTISLSIYVTNWFSCFHFPSLRSGGKISPSSFN